MPACPNCGEDNPDRARFCLSCGQSLEQAPSEAREVRKTVTVVFSDVTGSTSLGERLDPESLRRVMTRYFDEMRVVLERHGGTVEKFIGDAVMAVFGIPQLHEDDALRALRAASEMRDALARLNEDLERDWGVRIATRTGVNTGEVVAGDPTAGQSLVTGDAVNVAARLEQSAQPGEVLIGESTYRLTRDAITAEPVEPLSLKGKADAVAAHRLVSVTPGVEGVARRLDSPLVGREGELTLLRQALDRATRERGCHLFTVLGPAGIGKTRLVDEFVAGLDGEAVALRGRALPYGEGITFWPVAEAVKSGAGILDDDSPDEARSKIAEIARAEQDGYRIAERVAHVIGLEGAGGTPEETFWAVRKMFEAMAHRAPLVIVFDDGHWAEPTFLDLVEHVADWTHDAPILLLFLARPELLDQRPGWGGGKLNATSILLEPLSTEETERLVDNLLGGATLDVESRRRIVESSEGNPLFVEQLVAMLIDEGLLRRDDGHWIPAADLSRVSVPPTIQALLAARLDRLGAEERHVMERAAIVGRVFYPGAVIELAQEAIRPRIPGHLMTLVRKELIRPDRTSFAGEEAFRFRHLFVRDAAYEGMPKEARADLHERFAGWLERAAGERAPEYEEILGYHLEQAYRYRSELGPLDEHGRRLGAAAGERLVSSGRRAHARGDMRAASDLLDRGLELLPPDAPDRASILVDLAVARSEAGDYPGTFRDLDQAIARAAEARDQGTEAAARLERAFFLLSSESTGHEEFTRLAEDAVRTFRELCDDARLARALLLQGLGLFWTGRSAEGEQAFEQSHRHARVAGDLHRADEATAWYCALVVFGHVPAEEGARRAAELLTEDHGKHSETFLTQALAFVEAMRGNFDEAQALMAQGEAILEDIGMAVHLAAAHPYSEVQRHVGDWQAMVDRLGIGIETLERMGERGYLSTSACYLGDALYRLGRYEEAERATEKAEANAASDDVASQMAWRGTRARVLARRGELAEAERLARESVALGEATDFHIMRGDAWLDLAEMLRLAGRVDEAVTAGQEAIACYEQKGDLVLVARARDMIEELEASKS